MPGPFAIRMTVNGRRVDGETRSRTLLSDFLDVVKDPPSGRRRRV